MHIFCGMEFQRNQMFESWNLQLRASPCVNDGSTQKAVKRPPIEHAYIHLIAASFLLPEPPKSSDSPLLRVSFTFQIVAQSRIILLRQHKIKIH